MNERPAAPSKTVATGPHIFRTVALSSLGGALEFYDFVIFAFLSKLIAAHFFPHEQSDWLRQTETFGLFGTGYLIRPLGGIIMAHFGDKIGRKAVFTLSVLLMALPTLLIGCLPDYAAIGPAAPIGLLVLRMLQGAAIGGEAPGAWVFVAEHAPDRRIGLSTGALTGGLTFGILLGSVTLLALYAFLSTADVAAWGWRIPFALGGLFGLTAAVLRRWLNETPVFLEMQSQPDQLAKLPAMTVMRDHRRAVFCAMIATWALTSNIVALILMMPVLMQTLHHLPAGLTMQASFAATLCLTISVITAGGLSDRFSPKRLAIIWGILLAAAAFIVYAWAPLQPDLFVLLLSLAGLCAGLNGLIPAAMLRAFPPAIRFSGLSISYNLAYAIFGGLTPVIVSSLARQAPWAPAIYVALSAIGGGTALLFIPSLTAEPPER